MFKPGVTGEPGELWDSRLLFGRFVSENNNMSRRGMFGDTKNYISEDGLYK
jgi:hypothetical protein